MPNGFDVLVEAHRNVARLFELYDDDHEDAHVRQIAEELTVHAEMEEQVLYPELRRLVDGGDDLADAARDEHAAIRAIVSRYELNPPPDLGELVGELRELVERHVEEEESTIFPEMRDAGVDADELGRRLVAAEGEASSRSSGSVG